MESSETKRLSKATIAEYKERLADLKNIVRLEVAQQIKEARAFGDISENAEYDAAMDHQARIEYEISQLEDLLANVEEIDESNFDLTAVNVGCRVKLIGTSDSSEYEFDIVSTSESDPFGKVIKVKCDDTDENKRMGYTAGELVEIVLPSKLSNESPIGRAVIGHKLGDTVDVSTPKGTLSYTVMGIEKIPFAPKGKIISDKITP